MRAVTCSELERIFLPELAKEHECRDIQAVKIYPAGTGDWYLRPVRVGPSRRVPEPRQIGGSPRN
jgi:hypothetical protein